MNQLIRGSTRSWILAIALSPAALAAGCANGGDSDLAVAVDTTTTELTDAKPANTHFLEGAVDIAVSAQPSTGWGPFACVLTEAREVWCFGKNDQGSLGRGPGYGQENYGGARAAPVVAPTVTSQCGSFGDVDVPCNQRLSNVRSVSVGRWHACALTAASVDAAGRPVDGRVYCWGANDRAQLGRPSSTPFSNVPVVARLASGAELANVVAVSAGSNNTCAVTRDPASGQTTVYCWGDARYQQVPFGGQMVATPTPVFTSTLTNVTDINAGETVCALQNGQVLCFGRNDAGQTGNGAFQSSYYVVPSFESTVCTPAQVGAASNGLWVELMWNGYAFWPPAVGAPYINPGYGLRAVSSTYAASCGADGYVPGGQPWVYSRVTHPAVGNYICHINNWPSTAPCDTSAGAINNFAKLVKSSGTTRQCAITTTGQLYCWGGASGGYRGQLGFRWPADKVGTPFAYTDYPNNVASSAGAIDFTTAGSTASAFVANAGGCAVRVSATGQRVLECWGDNGQNRLGRLTADSSTQRCALSSGSNGATNALTKCSDSGIPVQMLSGVEVTRVATSDYTTCAVLANGRVACLGTNGFLGNPATPFSAVPSTDAYQVVASVPTPRRYSVSYAAIGAAQHFVVPAGTTAIEVKAWGAAGGSTGPLSGAGGFASHPALAVTPGETLEVVVGSGGDARVGDNARTYGGGGAGSNNSWYAWSGSGGGRSALRRAGADILTAGGGGGTGYPVLPSRGYLPNGPGGDGCSGFAGGGASSTSYGGGLGGTQSAGGAGGTDVSATPGNAGALGQGGDGLRNNITSGGGGGGYFGGGGGAHRSGFTSGGGGGGGCFVPAGGTAFGTSNSDAPAASDVDYVAGTARATTSGQGGPGRVVIHYLCAGSSCSPDTVARRAIFTSTGAMQTFVVPTGVTSLSLKLWGAGGGSAGTLGGGGGFVAAQTFAVTPGETLQVVVGSAGDCRPGVNAATFGGGGRGSDNLSYCWSGSGGGRSALQRFVGGVWVDVATAGGGGGAGYPSASQVAGAGCAGIGGAGGIGSDSGGGSGAGGSLTAGGAGGVGATATGGSGSQYQGGDGVSKNAFAGGTSGGGGGGYFGGGAGGYQSGYTSGSGGGGSCFVPTGGAYAGGSGATAGGAADADNAGAGRGATSMGRGQGGRVVIRY